MPSMLPVALWLLWTALPLSFADCGFPVPCDGTGVCNDDGTCTCPFGLTATDTQCRWKQWEQEFLARQITFLIVYTSILAWMLVRARNTLTTLNRWAYACCVGHVAMRLLYKVDWDAHYGIWGTDGHARHVLISLGSAFLFAAGTLLVRMFAAVLAKFHAPTRTAVRVFDWMTGLGPGAIAVAGSAVGVAAPTLWLLVINALAAIYVVFLLLGLQVLRVFLRLS